MIPNFARPEIALGPLTVHGFGLMVAAAVIVGVEVLRRRAITKSLEPNLAQRLVVWMLIGGFLGAHLVDRPGSPSYASADASERQTGASNKTTAPGAASQALLCIPELSTETKANVADVLARVLAAQILRELREEG
jgi:hypothetical protein